MIRIATLLLTVCTFTSVWAGSALQGLSSEKYKNLMMRGLSQVNTKLHSPNHPLEFGVNLTFAHEAWIGGFRKDVLLKAVDAVVELGAQRVDINMGAYPWLDGDEQVIQKYDAVVERIRQFGLKVNINPQYSPVMHKYRSFTEWEKAASRFYPVIAARFKPDTFVVIHEPTTMASRLGVSVNPEQWTTFAQRMAKLVKKTSLSTRIGAGDLHTERNYFRAFADIEEIEVLTLDIYSLKGLKTINELINIARRARKPVYIEETGRPPFFIPKPGQSLDQIAMQNIGNSTFEEVDIEWAKTMAAYSSVQRLEGITFFWMHILFKYVNDGGHANEPVYNRAIIKSIMEGNRTQTFKVLKELIYKYQRRKPTLER
jgi:hypothetical protein